MQLEYRTISETSDLIRSIKGISQHIKMTYRSPIRDHLMDIAKVSAVIITYNEEAVISETLSRLWWCNEIVVIDSGSTDKTLEICSQYGCNIFHRPFDGFGAQKNFGVS